MSTDLSASFNEQYMNINTKMKKRFMRKPNISEATNEFIALAIQCEHSDQPSFAGHAYVGAAKCEASVGHFLGEAEHFLAAARQFMKAEKKLKSLKFYSADRENLEAATGCYIQALNKYPEKSPIRTSIVMELASDLIELNHKLEASAYYEQAIDTVTESTMKTICLRNLLNLRIDCGMNYNIWDWPRMILYIKEHFNWDKVSLQSHSMGAIAGCTKTLAVSLNSEKSITTKGARAENTRMEYCPTNINLVHIIMMIFFLQRMENLSAVLIIKGKYDIALEIANKITDCTDVNIQEDILAEVQVSRILLTLLVKPPEDSKPPLLKQLFIDLMNDNESDAIPLNTDLRLKLQSIIISHTTGDIQSLISVTADTKHFLTLQQVELLHKLISDERG